MRTSTLICAAALFALSSLAQADNTQNTKMTDCNAQAKVQSLSGDARKTFMKSCLSAGSPATAELTPQQQKMKTCNAEAKSKALTGDARKSFMKTCLSGPAN